MTEAIEFMWQLVELFAVSSVGVLLVVLVIRAVRILLTHPPRGY